MCLIQNIPQHYFIQYFSYFYYSYLYLYLYPNPFPYLYPVIIYTYKMNSRSLNELYQDASFSTQFVKTGQRPQNFIKNVDPSMRYNKYPRTNQLMQQKSAWIKQRNHPPVYLKEDLSSFNLDSLGKFDLIYCDPPWQQYENRAKGLGLYNEKPNYYKAWSLQQISSLQIDKIADNPSFIFLWVGAEHLDDGRQLFRKWGYKRCEDITWVKTNIIKKVLPKPKDNGLFVRVKQHCLVGFKGDAKKASEHTFIHPNIDIDVVVTQQPELGSLQKPGQLYDIIERFCLGRKKLQLFGTNDCIRNGWLTIGSMLAETKFDINEYNSWFEQKTVKQYKGGRLMGTTPVIESLRPKQQSKPQEQRSKLLFK